MSKFTKMDAETVARITGSVFHTMYPIRLSLLNSWDGTNSTDLALAEYLERIGTAPGMETMAMFKRLFELNSIDTSDIKPIIAFELQSTDQMSEDERNAFNDFCVYASTTLEGITYIAKIRFTQWDLGFFNLPAEMFANLDDGDSITVKYPGVIQNLFTLNGSDVTLINVHSEPNIRNCIFEVMYTMNQIKDVVPGSKTFASAYERVMAVLNDEDVEEVILDA